ncbi:MAG: RNA-binding S4 domain-containing protein [Desulfitobacteriaceae bacterium]|nr:RNA-binding S4 domain-containing protein [Desulfitobacteriaceae bacterium]MDD4346261.1 RNA-binding S4 domain-containing protein [Desulfitobacteriaceae bacterium]MDD4400269.1 RNA-binding S4 domain-containing protein [Desulfitobacteriaceae bacterium]
MRIDKFLKVSRLIKRRTVAKDICEGGKIALNGKIAKPSAEVKVGDIIIIEIGHRLLEVKILDISSNVRANEAASLYEVLRDQRKTESV